jgi:hypothetical protein
MARGGARPGAGRKAGKSANTSPLSRARAPAREAAGIQRPWPADKVERWSIDRLIPYAKNARTHTDAQVAAIAASIKEWGWTSPALVGEDGGLIAGHARVLAARQLGIAKIPVMVAAGWTEAQKRAYVLADNQLAITGSGWDPELLRLELGELKLGGFDLSLTGFGDLELKDIMADRTGGLTDRDDAPAVPEHPVSVAGDLWLLGRHRLLCGDSTVATDVERVLGGVEPHLMVTDPPYGVDYDPDWRNRAERASTGRPIGARATGRVENDGQSDIGEGSAQEQSVVGETPNLASRLQALAEPGAVVIAAGTRRLLGGLFEYRDLGAIEVKGIAAPVSAWQVLHPSAVASRFEALRGSALTRLVGRDEEIDDPPFLRSCAASGAGSTAGLSASAVKDIPWGHYPEWYLGRLCSVSNKDRGRNRDRRGFSGPACSCVAD